MKHLTDDSGAPLSGLSTLAGVPGWAILSMIVAMILLAAWWALEDEAEDRDDEPYDWAAEGDFDDQE